MDNKDHDLLIVLNENVSSLRVEVQNITTSITGQIADHETRLRLQEAATERNEGSMRAWKWVLAVVSTLLVAAQAFIVWISSQHK